MHKAAAESTTPAARSSLWAFLRPRRATLPVYHLVLLGGLLALWKLLTSTGILPPFFFGDPVIVFGTIVDWFVSGEIYRHLWITRSEEHTSELQSLMRISYAVFCLKKKKTQLLSNIYVLFNKQT